eukprot:gene36801-45402_t
MDIAGCAYISVWTSVSWTQLGVSCGAGYSAVTVKGSYIVLAYASTAYVAVSSDRGASFTIVNTGSSYSFTNVVSSDNGQYLAATSSGADCIRLSFTYGLTWSCSPSSAVAQWTTLSMDSSGSGLVAGGANSQLYSLQTVYGDDDAGGSGGSNKKNFWDPILSFNWNSYAGYAIIFGGILVLCGLTQQCIKWRRARLLATTQTNNNRRTAVNRTLDLQSIASSHMFAVERQETTPVVIHHTASSLANAMYDRDASLTPQPPQRVSPRMLGIVDESDGAPSAPPVVVVEVEMMPRQQTNMWEMEHNSYSNSNRDAGFYEIDLNRISFTQQPGGSQGRGGGSGRGQQQQQQQQQLDQIDYDDFRAYA